METFLPLHWNVSGLKMIILGRLDSLPATGPGDQGMCLLEIREA